MMVYRFLLFLYAGIFSGCAPMANYIPPVPMKPGTTAVTLQGVWPMGRTAQLSLQVSAQTAVGERGILGVGFFGITPGSVSYARYYDVGGSYLNWQVHLTNAFFSSISYSPILEADIGYGAELGESSHAARLGVAYMGPMLFEIERIDAPPSLGRRPPGILPTAGYGLQWRRFVANVGVVPFSTRYFARQVKELRKLENDTVLVLRPQEIASIDSSAYRRKGDSVMVIHLTSGGRVELLIERPYGWGSVVWGAMRQDRFTASPRHRNYHMSVLYRPDSIPPASPRDRGRYYVVELDLQKILREYERTGTLVIAQDRDVDERAIERVGFGWEDATFAIGYLLQTE